MKNILKITFLFLSGVISITAQNNITGIITDDKNSPLPFANIILYDTESSKPITASISDDEGVYHLVDLPDGNYWIEVSMLGFESKKSNSIILTKSINSLNFFLKEKIQTLNEVVIKASRPIITQTSDKLIINLENSQMINNNIQDVIKKVPGIIIKNGNINYAGQGRVRVLINGKTTDYIDINSLLRDMPADNIAKVELIQQPGAEFDAEGSGPLINIVLKKNVKIGFYGNVTQTFGYVEDFMQKTGVSISSYKNKLNWQASANYSKSSWREDLFITRKVLEDTYKQASIAPENPQNFSFNVDLDYYINDNNTIGINSKRFNSNSDRVTNNSTTIITSETENTLFTDNSFNRERVVLNINPYYEFKNTKSTLTLDFNYVTYNDINKNNLFKIGESSIDYDNRRYFQDGAYEILTYKGDYKKTLNDNFNWSAGVKYAIVNSDSNLHSLTQNDSGNFIENTSQSNHFLIDESILGVYSKINLKLDKWNFSGGLRWEESKTNGISLTQEEIRSRNISKLFPSASFGREISKNIGFNLAYSYRINRPSYNSLNAFVLYYDAYTFEQGNPDLKASYTNKYQFNLTKNNQPFFSINYSSIKDDLFQILRQDDNSAEISRSTINIAENSNFSFNFFIPLKFINNLEGFTGFIVNNKHYKSNDLMINFNQSKWGLTWHINAEYKLPYNINSEISGHYTTGGLEGQVEYKHIAGIDLAFSKKFLNNRLKVALEWEEIINSPFKGIINYNNINANITNNWVNNNIYLQLNYSFGSKFNKGKHKDNSSKEEQDRIDSNN